MNAECRTIAPSESRTRSVDEAAVSRPWRHSGALRGGVLAAAVALAGCAGMPGPMAPASGTPPAPPGSASQNPAAPFTAAVSPVGASRVRLGDPVSFVLSAGTAGYGHLYIINTSGTVVALAESLAIAPGAPVLFPAPDAGFTIRASAPVGINRVLLLVTRQPFPGLGGGGAGAAPVTLTMPGDAFIANLNAATARLPGNGWVLAETRVEVVAAGG